MHPIHSHTLWWSHMACRKIPQRSWLPAMWSMVIRNTQDSLLYRLQRLGIDEMAWTAYIKNWFHVWAAICHSFTALLDFISHQLFDRSRDISRKSTTLIIHASKTKGGFALPPKANSPNSRGPQYTILDLVERNNQSRLNHVNTPVLSGGLEPMSFKFQPEP